MQPVSHDATTALLRALTRRFGAPGGAELAVDELRSRAWASVTFTGARHEIGLRIEGESAWEAAGAFLDGLEAAEFALRGHLLADIEVVSQAREPGRVRIALEALTVEEG